MQDGVGSSWRTQEIHLDLKPRFESQAVRDGDESPKMEEGPGISLQGMQREKPGTESQKVGELRLSRDRARSSQLKLPLLAEPQSFLPPPFSHFLSPRNSVALNMTNTEAEKMWD